MQLTTTVTHHIQFSVESFEANEGGMDHDTYGTFVESLPEAIRYLELAKTQYDKQEWLIVAHVSTKVK